MKKISRFLVCISMLSAIFCHGSVSTFADEKESKTTITILEGETNSSTVPSKEESKQEEKKQGKQRQEKHLPKTDDSNMSFYALIGNMVFIIAASMLYLINKNDEVEKNEKK